MAFVPIEACAGRALEPSDWPKIIFKEKSIMLTGNLVNRTSLWNAAK
jgi:hypothetical protein